MASKHTYRNEHEMVDGRTFQVRIDCTTGYADPAENGIDETFFYIDGMPHRREELPDEITDEIIAELIDSAR